ncbi:protein tesmin/TSO1-like CXC 3 [Dioscorea cayenensis subsp. rotundata]|uniref:Protein tesmin/TSO1-like CXC 3 n=1 Tax=Dioscorea cayennensis subsp. rotundata TaxID=55577 RepID=A0AB40CIQ0_DIOCR|nr:protein tesmin/TSO1-like CXC 3 [Dioscorea cayenensis subsp. rotundata]
MAKNSNHKSSGDVEMPQNSNHKSNGDVEMPQNSNHKSNGDVEMAQDSNNKSNGDVEMIQNSNHEAPRVPEVIVVQRGEWSEFERDGLLYCACEDSSLCFTEECPCYLTGSCCIKACLCKDCPNFLEDEDEQKEPSSQYIRELCYCRKSECLKIDCPCYSSGVPCKELCQCQGCLNCVSVMSDSVIDPELMGNVQPLAIQDKEMEAFWWFTNPQAISAPEIPQHFPGTQWGPSKRCSCKNSECLKFHCECFATSSRCSELCICQKCHNRIGDEESIIMTARKVVESRDPLAFTPKSILISYFSDYVWPRGSSSKNQTYDTAMYTSGCACQYPGCGDRSCECFKSLLGCSSDCKCEGCQNLCGIKPPAF